MSIRLLSSTLTKEYLSEAGWTCSLITPSGWPLHIGGMKPTRSARPRETRRCSSHRSTTSPSTLHGVVGLHQFVSSNRALTFLVCAIYTSDEEKCVATARHLMRDGAMTDSYRMFALLSSLCQSPVSWYTSGPAQKYILRQIKALDAGHGDVTPHDQGLYGDANAVTQANANLDICLLMLYGHILFTSTSYTYALSSYPSTTTLESLWQANAV